MVYFLYLYLENLFFMKRELTFGMYKVSNAVKMLQKLAK